MLLNMHCQLIVVVLNRYLINENLNVQNCKIIEINKI